MREYQFKAPQWTVGKNFDGTGGFGPVMVTADELPAGATGLRIQSRLNGQVMQDANTSDMIFAVDETIALLAECLTLEPGDVIVTRSSNFLGATDHPGHAMIAGVRPGEAYHAHPRSGVVKTSIAAAGKPVVRVYRTGKKGTWS